MKKWERIIIYPLAVLAALYSFWSHDRLQAIYKLNSEKFIPAYEELQLIQDPNSGIADLYAEINNKSPVRHQGWILGYLYETKECLRIYGSNDCSNVDTNEYLKATIKALKNLATIGRSEPILKTINLAIKAAESELKFINFKEKNKEDYQNWFNDPNTFKNPDFQSDLSKLMVEWENTSYDFREALGKLMDKI